MPPEIQIDEDAVPAMADALRDRNPERGSIGRTVAAESDAEDDLAATLRANFGDALRPATYLRPGQPHPHDVIFTEMVDFLRDEGWIHSRQPAAGVGHHARDASGVVMEKFARLLVESKNSRLDIRLLFYALNSTALDDVLRGGCPADFAQACGCTRQNATKRLEEIQSQLGLPPRKGQRDAKARAKFSATQKQIWATAPKSKIHQPKTSKKL